MFDDAAKAHLHDHLRWVGEAGHADILCERVDGDFGAEMGSSPRQGRDRAFWEARRSTIEHAARAAEPVEAADGARRTGAGTRLSMSENPAEVTVDDDRVATRAGLVGAERVVSSDDPDAQARAILEDSELRTLDRSAAPGSFVEHRRSEDTVPPEVAPEP